MNQSQIVAKNPQDEKILYPEFNALKERYVYIECGFELIWQLSMPHPHTYLSTFLAFSWSLFLPWDPEHP